MSPLSPRPGEGRLGALPTALRSQGHPVAATPGASAVPALRPLGSPAEPCPPLATQVPAFCSTTGGPAGRPGLSCPQDTLGRCVHRRLLSLPAPGLRTRRPGASTTRPPCSGPEPLARTVRAPQTRPRWTPREPEPSSHRAVSGLVSRRVWLCSWNTAVALLTEQSLRSQRIPLSHRPLRAPLGEKGPAVTPGTCGAGVSGLRPLNQGLLGCDLPSPARLRISDVLRGREN